MSSVVDLRVESRTRPLALAAGALRFGWRIESDARDVSQRSYRIRVYRGEGILADPLWDSGTVASDRTIGIEMPSGLLAQGHAYGWAVDVVTSDETDEMITSRSAFETAPDSSLWARSDWITLRRHDYQNDDFRPAPYVRKQIHPRGRVARGRLHATAGGIYEAWVAGTQLGASSLAPGWTDYDKRVAFHTYDVTSHFRNGEPVYVGAVVADGWYSGGVGPFRRRNFWGKHPVWRCILVLEYEDGDVDILGTGTDWEGSFGPIHAADLLQGEVIDARDDLGEWSKGETRSPWRQVKVEAGPGGILVPSKIDAPAPIAEFVPVQRNETRDGTFVYDMGQNFAGRVRLRVRRSAGTIIRLRHGEMLNPDGTLYIENLRGARAADTFILSGEQDVFEPTFTLHGFRYVEITGCGDAPPVEDVTGVAVSSVPRHIGTLVTDSPLLDQITRNIGWSLMSNFVEVPTDCPSRDERAGWTGDAQIFAATSTYFADVEMFFSKWMDDVLDSALPNGAFSDIAPSKDLTGRLTYTLDGSSGYAEAGLVVPWVLYQRYGNTRVLEAAYDAGAGWVRYVRRRTSDLVWRANRNTDYGDWLAPVETPKDLTATAYFNLSIWIMARFAEVLGRAEDIHYFDDLFADASAAFRKAFVNADGTMPAGTQAAYTLALAFDLLLPEQRATAATALTADIESRGNLTTGFLSISRLLPLLTGIGRSDLAYKLALNEKYPSWGHAIKHGATTIWERWDGWRPETGFQDPLMNSFNHFALGSVGEWVFAAVGGITPADVGFRRIRIAPQIGFDIGRAATEVHSTSGPIRVSWATDAGKVTCDVTIPANTTAEVTLPAVDVKEGGERLSDATGVRRIRADATQTHFDIGSGSYSFLGSLPGVEG